MKINKFTLKEYSLLSIAFLFSKKGINEVVYVDLDPDVMLQSDGETVLLDIDNNGWLDFAFLKTSDTYIVYTTIFPATYTIIHDEIFAGPYLYQNKIAGPYLSVSGDFYYFPYVIEVGDSIDNNLSFFNYGYQEMAWKTEFPGGGVFGNGYWWPVINDRYVGIYFIDSELNYHYGWIRCCVDSAETITIKDYAYEVKPDVGIVAGDTIGDTTTTILEINNFDATIYSFDKTLFIHLSNINSNTEAQIYDLAGNKLIQKDITEQLTEFNMSEFPTGIYLVTLKDRENIYTKKLSIE